MTGDTIIVRALIDDGSQITAVRNSVAEKLMLEGPSTTLVIGTSGAKTLSYKNQKVVNFYLASLDEKFISNFPIEAVTMPEVTLDVNHIDIDPKKFHHLKNITFSEKLPMTKSTNKKVDILIGEPNVSQLFKNFVKSDAINIPSAAVYDIGTCLTGCTSVKQEQPVIYITTQQDTDIKEFFTLENIGIEDPTISSNLTAEEQQAEEKMKKYTFYDSKNLCWHTRLLWADKKIQHTNVKRASATATRVIKRFSKNENSAAWDSIQKVYQENLDLGITELVPSADLRKKNNFHYIAMSMVFKPESSSTPVRPVFNANLEMGLGEEKTSFNKSLLEGPNLLPQLQALILQFRYYQKVCLLDISKLYSRIRVSAEDAEFQRFFWTDKKMAPNEEKANLRAYRQPRLIFGSRSSPYQAQFVLKQHSKMFDNFFLANFAYLDDIFVGNDTVEQTKKDLNKLIWVLKQGDFPCHKIVSNDSEIINNLDQSLLGPRDETKIYGQVWNLKHDQLTFNFKKFDSLDKEKFFTKRECLSHIMSLYDLSGFIQPFHLKAKLIFQQSCQAKLNWEDKLTSPLQENFQKWISELPQLHNITVNRCFLPPGGRICFIASFCDSSNIGIGINTYVIAEDTEGKRVSNLAFCKAKVLPLKQKFTTPRGELCAAQLNSRAANYVADALSIVVGHKPKIYFFSDSEITLYRLLKDANSYKVWVANRIRSIQNSTNVSDWYKVDTSENPSDVTSRSAYLSEFKDSQLYWHGPDWLLKPDYKFKKVGKTLSEEKLSLEEDEIKKIVPSSHSTIFPKQDENIITNILDRHNNFKKSVNVLTWCYKFYVNLKEKVKPSKQILNRRGRSKTDKKLKKEDLKLTPEEISRTEMLLFKFAQHSAFSEEIRLLSGGAQEVQKGSEIKQLIPIWDEKDQILRHDSRIMHYKPVILPKNNQITQLFIKHIHLKYGHAGPSLTLYKARKQVWLTSGRQQVKKALYKCSCRPNIPLTERMGKLPIFRTENVQIWSRVGTDVFGPLYVKIDSDKSMKTYGILWTDLISRGIFVDLLESADTQGILRSLRKVSAIYGYADIYYSDNASYYTKASKELTNFMASIDWPQITKQSLKFKGKWIFATAASPFRNATSERLVSTIKTYLKKMINKHTLTFHELSTVLLEISAYINNRPIGFLGSDSHEDMAPISPSLLTIGREVEPLGTYSGTDPDLEEIYTSRKEMIQEFLVNWKANYLNDLSPTTKWLRRNPYKIIPGMVLFIKDENKMKDLWQKGQVVEVIRSKSDNLPRTVKLKTLKGTIIRPIQKLAIPESQILTDEIPDDSTHQSGNTISLGVHCLALPEITEENELHYLLQNPFKVNRKISTDNIESEYLSEDQLTSTI